MIPIKVEVCGLETVSLSSVKEFNYDFVIGKGPNEAVMTDTEVKALFTGGSENCTIS